MRKVTLGNVCQVVSGSTPKRNKPEFWNGTIPWVTPKEISDLSTPYLEDSLEKITDLGYRSCSTTMLPPNSVLLSSRAPIGLLAINKISVCTNQGFKSLIPSGEVYYEYLYYCLKHNVKALQSKGNGATFKELSKTAVEEFEIPLLPLDDQKRIAYLLSKVEGLIAQRKQHLQHLDDLLKSIFLEMFGDPVRNEKGWEKPELEQFGKISTGNTPPRKDSSNYSSKHIEWIKTDNISADSVFISQAVEHLSEIGITKARIVKKDALLVACIAGSLESIGRAALTDRTVAFNQQINAIQPNKDVNPFYLYALFKISRAYIQSHASKGMKKILTKGDFEKIKMIKPPIELQNQFATIVEKVEGIKSRYQQSLADLETLYGALSQTAFKGELDLSRVPLPPDDPEAIADPPATHESPHTADTFDLPAPSDLVTLNSPEGRNALLDHWLTLWLERLNNTPFSTQPFIEAAQQRLWELAEEDALELGAADYDYVRSWISESLERGHLAQTYNDDKNRVQLKAVSHR